MRKDLPISTCWRSTHIVGDPDHRHDDASRLPSGALLECEEDSLGVKEQGPLREMSPPLVGSIAWASLSYVPENAGGIDQEGHT